MGVTVGIQINYQNEEDARRAVGVTEDVIKLFMMMHCGRLDDVGEDSPLRLYHLYRKRIRGFRKDEWSSDYLKYSLDSLRRFGSTLFLDQCTELQRCAYGIDEADDGAFFHALCLAQSITRPQTPFEAVFRYEMTVSGSVVKSWCTFDGGGILHMEMISGEVPFDENDRTNARTADWELSVFQDDLEELQANPDGSEEPCIRDGVPVRWRTHAEHLVIPDRVKAIGQWAFEFTDNLRSVTLPADIRQIDDYAFAGCDRLEQIVIPAGVTKIGEGAFLNNKSLRRIVVPARVTEIGADAFRGCTALQSVTLPEGLETVGYCAFLKCPSLLRVAVPDSVTEFGEYAFGFMEFDQRGRGVVTENFVMVCHRDSEAHCYADRNDLTAEDENGNELPPYWS